MSPSDRPSAFLPIYSGNLIKVFESQSRGLGRNHELAVVRKGYFFRKSRPGEQIATFFPSVACSEDRFMTEILKMKERPGQ